MFANLAVVFLAVSAALATPVQYGSGRRSNYALDTRTPVSLNGWRGISSMDNFDNFYGADHFAGFSSETAVQTVVETEKEVVCHSQSIEIIQQKLVILQEMAKRIITEQICEVETQTFVFQQFTSSFSSFGSDISHSSGRHAGYDSNIASKYGSLVNSDGSLSTYDLGFSGSSVGSSTVVPSGSNWNDESSPSSVAAALQAAQSAQSSSSN